MSYTNTVLLTGGTGGLGYYVALNIARKYPKYLVIITGRSDPNSSAKKINTKLSQKNVAFLPLDLSSLTQVRAFAESWRSKNYPPIISLILNAGTQFLGPMETNEEGYEKTFMVNHLGHALLFHLFTPYLTPNARIIVTASGTHDPIFTRKNGFPDAAFTTAEELAHPNPETAHPKGMQCYNSSKLANVLWTYALARHLADAKSSITANAFNPGLMPGTGLARDYSPVAVGNRGVGNLRLIGLVGLGPASRVFTFHLLDSLLTTTTNISICPHMTSYSNSCEIRVVPYPAADRTASANGDSVRPRDGGKWCGFGVGCSWPGGSGDNWEVC